MSSFCFQGPQLLLPVRPEAAFKSGHAPGRQRARTGTSGRSPTRVDHAISKRPASQQQGREWARSGSPSLHGEQGPRTRHSAVHCPSQTQSGNKATAMTTPRPRFLPQLPDRRVTQMNPTKPVGRAMGKLVRLCPVCTQDCASLFPTAVRAVPAGVCLCKSVL